MGIIRAKQGKKCPSPCSCHPVYVKLDRSDYSFQVPGHVDWESPSWFMNNTYLPPPPRFRSVNIELHYSTHSSSSIAQNCLLTDYKLSRFTGGGGVEY